MENELIVKANKLIEARYNLNLNEQKVLLYAISKLERNKPELDTVEFDITEFSKIIETKGKRYEDFRDTVRSLRKRELIIHTEDKELITGWLSSIRIYKNTGKIALKFDDELIPYLLELKKRFTRYQLKNILYLKNKYSVRIYELLKQYENIEKREFELEKLKEILYCEDMYKDFKNFNRFVLDKTREEINEYTDIIIDYEKITRGRKVVGIKYSITSKDQAEKEYETYIKTNYNIPELKEKMGIDEENFNNKQIIELYTIAVEKADGEGIDIYEYVKLNYLDMKSKNTARNKFAYLKTSLENDYAFAVGRLKLNHVI